MTKDEAKKYLLQYRIAKKRIRRISEQIEELRLSKMSAGSPNLDGMPKGSSGSDLSLYASRLDHLERALLDEQAAAEQCLADVIEAINLLESETDREVLTLYYVRGDRWERVCTDLNYSWKQVFRIRNRALKALARLLANDDIE